MNDINAIRARWRGLGPWGPVTDGYNNGGCPSVFLPVPGREDGQTIEVREEEGVALAAAPDDIHTLLAEIDRLNERVQAWMDMAIEEK